jgi:hypothetical protein
MSKPKRKLDKKKTAPFKNMDGGRSFLGRNRHFFLSHHIRTSSRHATLLQGLKSAVARRRLRCYTLTPLCHGAEIQGQNTFNFNVFITTAVGGMTV